MLKTSIQAIIKNARKHIVAVLLVIFFVTEAIAFSAVFPPRPDDNILLSVARQADDVSEKKQRTVTETDIAATIPKLSEIRGPRIDDEAAMIVIADEETAASRCFTLPADVWVLLLIAYIALLIFNLTYDFGRASGPKIQWFWEALFTLLFVVGWAVWDECRTNVWFPLYVIKMGVVIYAAYLYFFDKKMKK